MVIELLTRQPKIRLANTLTTKTTYSPPCQVETQVKSDTPCWFGRSDRSLVAHLFQRARRLVLADGGAHDLAALDASQAQASHQAAHQAFDRAARHLDALAVQLLPDLAPAVDLQVGFPHLLDHRHQLAVALRPGTQQGQILTPCSAPTAGRRGNLQLMLGSRRVSAAPCGLGLGLGSRGKLVSTLLGLRRLNQVTYRVAGLA